MSDENRTANPGYAIANMLRAQRTADEHPDAETRERALQRIERWRQTIEGMLNGLLKVGSRTPIHDIPAWATPEVRLGGFTTGNLAAGGPLLPHENTLLRSIPSAGDRERSALNAFYLTDEGLRELLRMLETGCYRILVPEEGALLVVAYLLSVDEHEEARELLSIISPFMDRLRFYPQPADAPQNFSPDAVHVATVGGIISGLQRVKEPLAITAFREFVQVWAPLYDRTVELWLETYEDGWPCQRYPNGWKEQAQTLVADYRRLTSSDHLCGKYAKAKGHGLEQLVTTMERAVADPARLSGREVARVRRIISGIEAKRGLPGTASHQQLRAWQSQCAQRPTTVAIAPAVVARLRSYAPDEGLQQVEIDAVTAPITEDEAVRHQLPSGFAIPPSLSNKVERALAATLDELVERQLIPSSEVLAKVLPQVSGNVRAGRIKDERLRRLDTAIYRAFRNRRSLLLFWYQHQVQIGELPWVAALERRHRDESSSKQDSIFTLQEVGRIAITAFPAQQLPNKLITELVSLARAGGLDIPFTEEIASDIFMGNFTAKYLQAAQVAGALLSGSLYERYYGLDYKHVMAISDVHEDTRWRVMMSEQFNVLCYELAGVPLDTRGSWGSVAQNGKVIEQELIVTTHNLSTLFTKVGVQLSDEQLEALAMQCFTHALHLLQIKLPDDRQSFKCKLRNIKNAAYAWRQMVFFLSLQTATPEKFFMNAQTLLSKQQAEFAQKFQPALDALNDAYRHAPKVVTRGSSSPLRFLGWTTERHWVLPPREEQPHP